MKNHSLKYQLTYIQKHDSKSFMDHLQIQKYLSSSQRKQLAKSGIDNMYEFMIFDGQEKRTVLKQYKYVTEFLQWYSVKFRLQDQITVQTLKNGYNFEEIPTIQPFKEKVCFDFMQLRNQELFHFSSIHLRRKLYKTRWYQSLSCCYNSWEDVDSIITFQGIIEKKNGDIVDFLLFTSEFRYEIGNALTGEQFGIQLKTIHRDVVFRPSNPNDFYQFVFFLNQALQVNKIKQIRHSASSFVRKYNNVDFIIDAQEYYRRVALAIEKAKQQIFICDWWLSPQLPMIRPVNQANAKYRLDRLLQRKASEGVSIYVLIFNNPPVVPNDAEYTRQALQRLHSKINVLLHPCSIIPGLWSHHEKIVVIDQKTSFMGGLDLCYGRYDGIDHPVNNNSTQLYPGIQYNNNRIKDFKEVSNFKKDGLPRNQPRMPWHDIALQFQGSCCFQSFGFNQDWKKIIALTLQGSHSIKSADGKFRRSSQRITQIHVNQKKKKKKARKQLDHMIHEYKRTKQKDSTQITHLILSTKSIGLVKLQRSKWHQIKDKYTDECQLLRSASEWSIGLEDDRIEKSIHQAFVCSIKNAKAHIYIESQFFVSGTGSKDSFVGNQIANALYQRIKRAIEQKSKLKVIIFMPLLPGIAGPVDEKVSIPLRLIVHWQYQTICRGQESLLKRISKLTSNPADYIQFYGLRQHGMLQNNPVTEIIYIHTKTMIVDDNIVICGSANINDRSMEGDRDSELALFVSQGTQIQTKMNNKLIEVSGKAHNLRVNLYREHFGFSQQQCQDPLDNDLAGKMRKIAKDNTEAFREIFRCYPDDNIKKLAETEQYMSKANLQSYLSVSNKIKGAAVQFPLSYLSEEDMDLGIFGPTIIDDIMI